MTLGIKEELLHPSAHRRDARAGVDPEARVGDEGPGFGNFLGSEGDFGGGDSGDEEDHVMAEGEAAG